MSYVEDLEAVAIHHKSVAELDRDATSVVQLRRSDAGDDLGLQGIFQVYNRQTGIAEHVSVNSGDRDATGAVQLTLRIESQCACQQASTRPSINPSRAARRFAL